MSAGAAQSRWTARRALLVGAVACALVALLLAGVIRATTPDDAAPQRLIGKPAPTFTLSTAQSGKLLTTPTGFGGQTGRPTLIVFFNTLCVRCLSGVQTAREVSAALEPTTPLDVLYVDSPGENAQITGAYFARLQFDPPALLDSNGAVAARYGVTLYPTLVLVDGNGVVRATWTGETPATLTPEIRRALAR